MGDTWVGRLAGSVGIVTGAGHGIGRAIARRFAAEGASTVIVDVDEPALHETARLLAGEALPIVADVRSPDQVEAMVRSAVDAFGGLDFLVNNAAWYTHGALVDTTDVGWDDTLEATLKSVYVTCKAVIPVMIDRGGGAIVNLGSINQIVANPHLPAYTAAKGGVRALSKQIAVEYGPAGIRCNVISPGLIVTDRIRAQLDPVDEHRGVEAYPLRRLGRVEDVAYAALYLVSAESSFVTGVDLPVDGGLTSLSPAVLSFASLRAKWGASSMGSTVDDDA